MAEIMGIDHSYYAHILSDKRNANIRMEHMERMLEHIKVNPMWLISGDGDMFVNMINIEWEKEPSEEQIDSLYKFVLEHYPTELSYIEKLKFRLACAQCYYDNPKIKSLNTLAVGARVYLKFIKAMPNLDLPGVLGG